jgi:hypothetical protein
MDPYNIYNTQDFEKSNINNILNDYLQSIDTNKSIKLQKLLNQITGDGNKVKKDLKIIGIRAIESSEVNKDNIKETNLNKKTFSLNKNFTTQFYSSESDI